MMGAVQPFPSGGDRIGATSLDPTVFRCRAEHVKQHNNGVKMSSKRKVEVFSAGCPACQQTIGLVSSVACPSCEVTILDMNDASVASRAKDLGIGSVPAVVIDGKLAACCVARGPDERTLRAQGLGQPLT